MCHSSGLCILLVGLLWEGFSKGLHDLFAFLTCISGYDVETRKEGLWKQRGNYEAKAIK